MSKPTNVVLWILQTGLAAYMITGALYMMRNHTDLSTLWARNTLPPPVWTTIGVLQIIFSLGLVLPAVIRKTSALTTHSAVALAIISLLGSILYSAYTQAGVIWAIVPAVVALYIAYKRR